jgi:hypothetical protein
MNDHPIWLLYLPQGPPAVPWLSSLRPFPPFGHGRLNPFLAIAIAARRLVAVVAVLPQPPPLLGVLRFQPGIGPLQPLHLRLQPAFSPYNRALLAPRLNELSELLRF